MTDRQHMECSSSFPIDESIDITRITSFSFFKHKSAHSVNSLLPDKTASDCFNAHMTPKKCSSCFISFLALSLCCNCWMEIISASICIWLAFFLRRASLYWLIFLFQSSKWRLGDRCIRCFDPLVILCESHEQTLGYASAGLTLFSQFSSYWFVDQQLRDTEEMLVTEHSFYSMKFLSPLSYCAEQTRATLQLISHRNRCDATANYPIPERFLF